MFKGVKNSITRGIIYLTVPFLLTGCETAFADTGNKRPTTERVVTVYKDPPDETVSNGYRLVTGSENKIDTKEHALSASDQANLENLLKDITIKTRSVKED